MAANADSPSPRATPGRRHHISALLHSVIIALLTVASFASVSPARAGAPFYQGRTLTLLINFAVGGPADVEGRLFAKYIGRHIAGHPNVLVQNMEGAGGVVGAKYLGSVAPKDGTVVGYFTGTGFMYALDPSRFNPGLEKYDFVAIQGGATVTYVRTDVPPGLKTPADIVNARGLIAGGLSADSSKDVRIRLALDMLGIKYKYVTGYRSSAPARLAFQRGEINVFAESTPSYRSIVVPDLVDRGEAIPLWYDAADADKPSSQMAGLPILPFPAVYQKIKGAPPSGPVWDNYRAINGLDGAMLRMICFPPGTPPAARAALAAAVAELNTDKDHAAEAMATIGFVPEWQTGTGVQQDVQSLLAMPADERSFLNAYIKAANK
jgi:tripartite-type tricarboxylate transporter receptor subunit TctC